MGEKIRPSDFFGELPLSTRFENGFPPQYQHVFIFNILGTGEYFAYTEYPDIDNDNRVCCEAVLLNGLPISPSGEILPADIIAGVKIYKDSNAPTEAEPIPHFNPILMGPNKKLRTIINGDQGTDVNEVPRLLSLIRGEKDLVPLGIMSRGHLGKITFANLPSK